MSVRTEELKYLYSIELADRATAPLLKASREQERAIDVQSKALKKLGDTTGKVTTEQKDAARQTAAAAQLRAREAERAAQREIAALKNTGKAYGQEAKQAAAANDHQRRSIKGLIGGLGGLGAAYGAFNYAKSAISTTEELAKTTLTLSRSFGLDTKVASEWTAVAKARGAEGAKLVMGFKSLATAIYNAESGSKQQIDTFAKLGITQVDLANHGNDLQYMLRLISDGLAKLPAGSDKAALSAKLFGRTWVAIAPIIRDGSKAMDEQLAMAEKYGVTFNGHTIKSVHELALAQREAKLASLGLQLTLGTTLVPALTELTVKANEFVVGVRRDWPQIKREIDPIVKPIAAVADGIGDITDQHPELITVVGVMATFGSTVKAIKFASAISGVTTFLKVAAGAGGLPGKWGNIGTRAGGALATNATTAASTGLAAEAGPKGRMARAGTLVGSAFRVAFLAAATFEIAETIAKDIPALAQYSGSKGWGELWKDIKDDFAGVSQAKAHEILTNPNLQHMHRRRGGIIGFQAGGVVPAFVSPGEEVHYGTGSWTVPGAKTAADSVFTMLPVGAAVVTGHGQQLMASGASLGEALAYQAPHFQTGGTVVKGKTSTFGPPGEAAGTTASGASSRFAGVAIRPGDHWQSGRPYLGGYWEIDLGKGHRGVLRQTDLGPNEWTGRRIDITGAGAKELHLNPASFPTDSVGTARYLGKSGQGHKLSSQADATIDTYRQLGKSPLRSGLLPDALAQGISAGASGAKSSGVLDSVLSAGKAAAQQLTLKGKGAPADTGTPLTLPKGGANLGHHKPDLAAAMALAQQAGLKITSTTGGKHAKNSYHYSGHAFDASNGTNTPEEKKYAKGIAGIFGTNLKEMFYDPLGWYVKDGRAVPGKIGGHSDHVHVAMLGESPFSIGRKLAQTKNQPAKYFRAGGTAGRVTRAASAPVARTAVPAVAHFRDGGPVSFRSAVSTAASGAPAATSLPVLDRLLSDVTERRLLQLRTQMLRAAQKGGDERAVKRFQQILDLVNGQLGYRIGQLQAKIEQRTARTTFATGLVDRRLRQAGTASDSVQGLQVTAKAADQFEMPGARANVREAQAAFRKAQRAHADPQQLRTLQQGITDAIATLDEALVSQVERRRQIIQKAAQDKVDDAQFRVDWNNAGTAFLDASQRVDGTADTAGGQLAKAAAITDSLPGLAALKTGYEEQGKAALQTGDFAGFRQALLAAQGAATDLANAQADAADLVKQAAQTQAQGLVTAADFQHSIAQSGYESLQLDQQLAGTDKTAAGGLERQTYIRGTIIPALQKEIEAQKGAEQAALVYGADSEQYRTEHLKLLQLQIELQRDNLDAANAVKENTEPLRDLAGSSTFDFRGERFNAGLLNLAA